MIWELDSDLFYVITFGPGTGESVVLRVPPDRWIVVDGCHVDGVSPASKLIQRAEGHWSAVVLTHDHFDHVCGLPQVLELEGAGPVACARPLLKLIRDRKESDDPNTRLRATVAERVLATIDTLWHAHPEMMWNLEFGSERQIGDATLRALWPDAAYGKDYESHYERDRNSVSTPLLVRWHSLNLLLGADLPLGEWRLLGQLQDGFEQHALFKVSHHCSETSVSEVYGGDGAALPDRFWVATPWSGKGGLPRFEPGQGLDRLLTYVERIHLTALPFAFAGSADAQPVHATRHEIESETKCEPLKVTKNARVQFKKRRLSSANHPLEDNYVAVGFAPDGSIKATKYGRGSVVVSR